MAAALQLNSNSSSDSASNNNGSAIINIVTPNELLAATDAADDSGSGASGNSRLARSLVSVGFLTLLMDAAVVLYKPPGGVLFGRRARAYYLTLAGIFAAGVAELWAAFSLSRSSGRRRGAPLLATAVLYASVVPLVVVIDLGGFSVLVKV